MNTPSFRYLFPMLAAVALAGCDAEEVASGPTTTLRRAIGEAPAEPPGKNEAFLAFVKSAKGAAPGFAAQLATMGKGPGPAGGVSIQAKPTADDGECSFDAGPVAEPKSNGAAFVPTIHVSQVSLRDRVRSMKPSDLGPPAGLSPPGFDPKTPGAKSASGFPYGPFVGHPLDHLTADE